MQKITIVGKGFLGTAIYKDLQANGFNVSLISFKELIRMKPKDSNLILVHTTHICKNHYFKAANTLIYNLYVTNCLTTLECKKYIFLSSQGVHYFHSNYRTNRLQHFYDLSKYISEYLIQSRCKSFLIYRLDRIYDKSFNSDGYVAFCIKQNLRGFQKVTLVWLETFLQIFRKTFLNKTGIIEVKGQEYTFDELRTLYVEHMHSNQK